MVSTPPTERAANKVPGFLVTLASMEIEENSSCQSPMRGLQGLGESGGIEGPVSKSRESFHPLSL